MPNKHTSTMLSTIKSRLHFSFGFNENNTVIYSSMCSVANVKITDAVGNYFLLKLKFSTIVLNGNFL